MPYWEGFMQATKRADTLSFLAIVYESH